MAIQREQIGLLASMPAQDRSMLAGINPAISEQILLLHLVKVVEHLINCGDNLGIGFKRTLSDDHIC
jgi:hypothetical protein